ncbi:hypothetical protein LguiA_025881 [Lonicera macranthoides]
MESLEYLLCPLPKKQSWYIYEALFQVYEERNVVCPLTWDNLGKVYFEALRSQKVDLNCRRIHCKSR